MVQPPCIWMVRLRGHFQTHLIMLQQRILEWEQDIIIRTFHLMDL